MRDNLKEPKFVPKGCDFICFSDSSWSSKKWIVKPIESIDSDPVLSAKIYKILPHHFLKEYEYSIWVDGYFVIRGDVTILLEKYLAKAPMALYKHPQRNCIYEEAEACIELNKDNAETIRKQMELYRAEGYPKNNGLLACGLILRKNCPVVNKNDEDWWLEIRKHSKRDQLSFPYIARKNNLSYAVIDDNVWDNPYIKKVPHRKKKKPLLPKWLFPW